MKNSYYYKEIENLILDVIASKDKVKVEFLHDDGG